MFHYAVSLYSFDPLLAPGDVTKRAAMRFARAAGFQGVEMLDMYWSPGQPREDQAERLEEDACRECLTIACYTVHNNLALFEEGPWQTLVDRLLLDVDLAKRMGTRLMRVESSSGPAEPCAGKSFEECVGPIARGLKTVARRAAEKGITLGLENHGRFIGSSERVERIIEAVDEPNFGACVDIGNFLVVDEDPVPAVTRLAPHAIHVHAKDMHFFETDPGDGAFRTNAGRYLRGAVLGEGVVDVPKCLDVLAKAGYDGWLALEFEGRENLFVAIRKGLENLAAAAARLPLRT